MSEALHDNHLIALRMYTSCTQLKDQVEMCAILRWALVTDKPAVIEHAVMFARMLTKYTNTGRCAQSVPARELPIQVWRGGGLPKEHQHFFIKDKSYRAPCFLSTTETKAIAKDFMRGQSDKVIWTIRFGKSGGQPRCDHANFVDRHNGTLNSNPNQAAEDEWLLSPYSAFTVTRVVWQEHPTAESPNEVELLAEINNCEAPEDLPNSPWS